MAELNDPLPVELGAFDAVLAVDVVLHLRDRQTLFREVPKLLRPGRRFLFTDAGVVTGAVSNDEIQRRGIHGYTGPLAECGGDQVGAGSLSHHTLAFLAPWRFKIFALG